MAISDVRRASFTRYSETHWRTFWGGAACQWGSRQRASQRLRGRFWEYRPPAGRSQRYRRGQRRQSRGRFASARSGPARRTPGPTTERATKGFGVREPTAEGELLDRDPALFHPAKGDVPP